MKRQGTSQASFEDGAGSIPAHRKYTKRCFLTSFDQNCAGNIYPAHGPVTWNSGQNLPYDVVRLTIRGI